MSSHNAALSYDECLAWAEKYASTPFNMLALVTASAGDPGPMVVMRSLFGIAAELKRQNDVQAEYWRNIDA